MEKFKQLTDLVATMESDFVKFYDQGNKAAGTRVRAAMQQIAQFAKATRAEVSEIKNGGAAGGAAADKDED